MTNLTKTFKALFEINLDKSFLLNKIKKPMCLNVLIVYLHHSITIFRTGELGLCTKENIKGYVNLFDRIQLLIKIKSFYKIYEVFKLSLCYIFFRSFKKKYELIKYI